MNELHLFAGAGGGILGGMLLGHTCVCAVEIEPYCRRVLLQRQRDGMLPKFPIWDDIRTFDGRPWRGLVDVVCGGFPCQDISAAGKGAGINGERSGLWGEMARVVREVGPRFVFVENSPMLTSRGLGRVLGDLATLGYNARWCVLGAIDAGAPHRRDRIWILADNQKFRRRKGRSGGFDSSRAWELKPTLQDVADAAQLQCDGCHNHTGFSECGKQIPESGNCCGTENVADAMRERIGRPGNELAELGGLRQGRADWARNGNPWDAGDPADNEPATESFVGRVADGVAHRVDRLRAIGNGQVPAVAALAWNTLVKED